MKYNWNIGFQHETNPGGDMPICSPFFWVNESTEKCALELAWHHECCYSSYLFFFPSSPAFSTLVCQDQILLIFHFLRKADIEDTLGL